MPKKQTKGERGNNEMHDFQKVDGSKSKVLVKLLEFSFTKEYIKSL